jgi:hypothetical protein
VTVDIEDAGLGIPERSLADINDTLHSGGEVTPDTARRMGLFVVSRLAQRHGITVSLKRNPGSGITAVVLLPARILDVPSAVARDASPVRPVEPAAALPQRTPTPSEAEPASLEDRLSAAIGLPRREPGAQVPETAPTPLPALPAAEPAEPAPAPAATERPHVEETPAAAAAALPTREPTPLTPATAPDAPAELTWPSMPVEIESDRHDEGYERADRDDHDDQDERAPSEPLQTAAAYLARSEPVPSAPSSDPLAAGRAPFPPLTDSEAEADTPIFRAVRSAWLSANATLESWRYSEVEAGWAEADRVADSEVPVNAAGLPTRRPGSRLVPGGVTKPATVGARDPEAVRSRLAAHAAGVSRGRAATTASPDQHPSEENPA